MSAPSAALLARSYTRVQFARARVALLEWHQWLRSRGAEPSRLGAHLQLFDRARVEYALRQLECAEAKAPSLEEFTAQIANRSLDELGADLERAMAACEFLEEECCRLYGFKPLAAFAPGQQELARRIFEQGAP